MGKKKSKFVRIDSSTHRLLTKIKKITGRSYASFLNDVVTGLYDVIGNFEKANFFYQNYSEKNQLVFFVGGKKFPSNMISGIISDVPNSVTDTQADSMVRHEIENVLNEKNQVKEETKDEKSTKKQNFGNSA